MFKSCYMIPIQHLKLTNPMKIDDFYLIPSLLDDCSWYDALPKNSSLDQDEYNYIKDILSRTQPNCLFEDRIRIPVWLPSTAYCFIDSEIIGRKIQKDKHYRDNELCDEICNEVNKVFDFLIQSDHILFHTLYLLPLLPGICEDGIKRCYFISNEKFIMVSSDISSLLKDGIGNEWDICNYPEVLLKQIEEFNFIFKKNKTDISKLCNYGIRRLTESLYMPSLDVSFIYLMSTFEAIASPDYMKFQDVKKKILPFICDDRGKYDDKIEYYKYLSKILRTEVIHNGKNLSSMLTRGKVINILNQLYSDIKMYLLSISGFVTFDELNRELDNRKKILNLIK